MKFDRDVVIQVLCEYFTRDFVEHILNDLKGAQTAVETLYLSASSSNLNRSNY